MRRDSLEYKAPLGWPLVRAILVHGGMAAAFIAGPLLGHRGVATFGSQDAGGGTTAVTPVASIPIPSRRDLVNPVANDTQSLAPAAPNQIDKRKRVDPEAIPIGEKKKKQEKKTDFLDTYLRNREKRLIEESQVTSSKGAQVSTPLIQANQGGGKLGHGAHNPFGDRFGAYAQLIRECIARKWNAQGISPGSKQAIVLFDIQRNGSVQNLKVAQTSGNAELDYSTLRAIRDCSPFNPLPAQFERNSATVEFVFELKR